VQYTRTLQPPQEPQTRNQHLNIVRFTKKTELNLDDSGNSFPQKMAAPSFGFPCPAAPSRSTPAHRTCHPRRMTDKRSPTTCREGAPKKDGIFSCFPENVEISIQRFEISKLAVHTNPGSASQSPSDTPKATITFHSEEHVWIPPEWHRTKSWIRTSCLGLPLARETNHNGPTHTRGRTAGPP
jgi:hypothetical protein